MAFTIHWKAPLQTKGFLKIIELVVAILCFSLVASYFFRVQRICTYGSAGQERNYTLTVDTYYPLYTYTLENVTRVPIGTPTVAPRRITPPFGELPNANVGQGAQLFVTWGVASMLYCIVALAVYMLITANQHLERVMDLLVYADLVFHIIWVFMWFVACVDWAVSYNALGGDIGSLISGDACTRPVGGITYSSTAQAGISVVFGFLSLFLWGVNIFWVVIDTPFYIQWKANRQSGSYQPTP